jgi:hypothetical protein
MPHQYLHFLDFGTYTKSGYDCVKYTMHHYISVNPEWAETSASNLHTFSCKLNKFIHPLRLCQTYAML